MARSDFYAVAFDPHGRLGWQSARIQDPEGDEGYDGAQIVEVLTEAADGRYLGYLRSLGIPYVFAGEREKLLFDHADAACFSLVDGKAENGNLILNYKRKCK